MDQSTGMVGFHTDHSLLCPETLLHPFLAVHDVPLNEEDVWEVTNCSISPCPYPVSHRGLLVLSPVSQIPPCLLRLLQLRASVSLMWAHHNFPAELATSILSPSTQLWGALVKRQSAHVARAPLVKALCGSLSPTGYSANSPLWCAGTLPVFLLSMVCPYSP